MPRSLKKGVFSRDLVRDQLVYGFCMGSLCLAAFMIVAFGPNGYHELPNKCNEEFSDGCGEVFEARATTFATLSYLLLITSWEVKHFHRSLFAMDERWSGPFSVFKTIYRNKFLFWSVVAGFCAVFPLIYIPQLNVLVFKHKAITWEWGVVFGCVATYIGMLEVWKATKRRFGLGIEQFAHTHGQA